MKKEARKCLYCAAALSRDVVGLNKKLFEHWSKQGRFTCLDCMAEMLECTAADLEEKIEEFKREGCKLF